jgi:hypothetical protein
MIDLMQSIIQIDCMSPMSQGQLLLTLFNTEEQCCTMLAVLKWLEDHAPEDTLNSQAYVQAHFPKEDPHWDPSDV